MSDIEVIKEEAGITIIRLQGVLNFYNSKEIDDVLWKNFDDGGKFVAIDLSESKSMDSSGLAMLVNHAQLYQREGGEIVIAGIADYIRSLFAITRVTDHCKVFETIESAMQYFSEHEK